MEYESNINVQLKFLQDFNMEYESNINVQLKFLQDFNMEYESNINVQLRIIFFCKKGPDFRNKQCELTSKWKSNTSNIQNACGNNNNEDNVYLSLHCQWRHTNKAKY